MRSGGSSNKPPAGIERDSEAQGLDGEVGDKGKVDDESSGTIHKLRRQIFGLFLTPLPQ